MQQRCSSAFSDRRRDLVVSRICSSIAAKINSSLPGGNPLKLDEISELHQRISRLYDSASVSRTLSQQARLRTDLNAATQSKVTQQQIDEIAKKFGADVAERRRQTSTTQNAAAVACAKQQLQPDLLSVDALLAERTNSDQDAKTFFSPKSVAERCSSAAADTRSLNGSFSPAPLLSRSATSLRSSAELIMRQMNDSPSPASKRLRRMIRDADEYQRAIENAELEKRESEEKKRNKLAALQLFKSSLDAQCRERLDTKNRMSQLSVEERHMMEADADQFLREEKDTLLKRREKLERQKRENENMRITLESLRCEEKKRVEEETTQELSEYHDAEAAAKKLDQERKLCQSKLLSDQMVALTQRRREESLSRLDDLRRASVIQDQLVEYNDRLDRKRQEQLDRVQKKLNASEDRSKKQFRELSKLGTAVGDQAKETWLQQKLQKETEELNKKAQERASRESQVRSQSQQSLKHILKDQILRKEHAKELEKAVSRQWGHQIQATLREQEIRDDLRKYVGREEAHEWVNLLDAQAKFKHFSETQDIVTSLARSPSVLQGRQGTPFSGSSCSSLQCSPLSVKPPLALSSYTAAAK